MPRTTIDNRENVLDSRDIIERIEELERDRDRFSGPCLVCLESGEAKGEACPECNGTGERADVAAWIAANPEGADELDTLSTLAKEGEGAEDWHHGATLIRDDYFTEYARETVTDCGYINADMPWWIVVDWEATARNIRVDYFPVDFDGVTYWIR